MAGPFTFPVAQAVPFEPNRNPQYGGNAGPSGITSENVQDAIEEAKADALANDRFALLSFYGGNAIVGRHLEFYASIASNNAPIFLSVGARLLSVVAQTTAATATCNIGLFNLNVSAVTPVYTIVMTAQKRVEFVGAPLATFPAGTLLALRVTSGSINTPTMQIVLSAST
jgi:hypothetical protein